MRKTDVWYFPGAFFVIACILNLIGWIWAPALADAVKPALLPLLSVTTLTYLLGRDHYDDDGGAIAFLLMAQLFGCAGDILLIRAGFQFFLGGMAAFLVGHVFYMCLFGGLSWKGLSVWIWAIAVALMAAAELGLIRAIGVSGEMLVPIIIYGFALMLLIFSALAGVIRMPKGRRTTWWILLLGALLFTFSDSCIAMEIVGVMSFPLHSFLVMVTYLAAQSLLAVGGIRLILGK
jgi:uncharacterized membrane protein YhhN